MKLPPLDLTQCRETARKWVDQTDSLTGQPTTSSIADEKIYSARNEDPAKAKYTDIKIASPLGSGNHQSL